MYIMGWVEGGGGGGRGANSVRLMSSPIHKQNTHIPADKKHIII